MFVAYTDPVKQQLHMNGVTLQNPTDRAEEGLTEWFFHLACLIVADKGRLTPEFEAGFPLVKRNYEFFRDNADLCGNAPWLEWRDPKCDSCEAALEGIPMPISTYQDCSNAVQRLMEAKEWCQSRDCREIPLPRHISQLPYEKEVELRNSITQSAEQLKDLIQEQFPGAHILIAWEWMDHGTGQQTVQSIVVDDGGELPDSMMGLTIAMKAIRYEFDGMILTSLFDHYPPAANFLTHVFEEEQEEEEETS